MQNTQPQFSMLTALPQQNAVLTVFQKQYAMLVSLQQQYAMLAAAQGQSAMQAATLQRQSSLHSASYVPRLSDPSSDGKRTEFILISSGHSTTLGNSGDTDAGISTMDEAAARKLKMAQMLANAGLAKRFQGKGEEANRLLQRARQRFQAIVANYGNTDAAAEARKKLAALSD
jgi:hypothetical protein